MKAGCNRYVAVVDGDGSVRRTFGHLLGIAGSQPITHASAEAFLADRMHPVFDCLLLDIRLTGMSGSELSRRHLETGGDTPVVFITAQNDAGWCQDAAKPESCGHFSTTKPGAVILDAIAIIIDGRCHAGEHEANQAAGLPA